MNQILKIRNVLLWSFILNYTLILAFWLISMTGMYDWLLDFIYGIDTETAGAIALEWIIAWKILAVALFLVPAIAIHWEYVWNADRRGR